MSAVYAEEKHKEVEQSLQKQVTQGSHLLPISAMPFDQYQ
jgi:hypothetical protein